MSASLYLLCCWLGLALLSTATVLLGTAGSTLALAAAVLLLALAKAWLITDGFMALRRGPLLWRGLLLGWPLLMAAGIGLTLLFPVGG